MKKYIFLLLVSCSIGRSNAQDSMPVRPSSPVTPANEYRQKMVDHIVFGSLALAGGTILYFTGKNTQEKATGFDFTGTGIATVGILIAAASVPLFIGAGHFHRKLKNVSAGLSIDKTSSLQQWSVCQQYFPAVTIKIRL